MTTRKKKTASGPASGPASAKPIDPPTLGAVDPASNSTGPQEITVLSVRQPFADGLIEGWKIPENRTWDTKFRGRLYIHASSQDPVPKREAILKQGWPAECADAQIAVWSLPGDRITGAIIGSVEVVDVVPGEMLYEIEGCKDCKMYGQTLTEALQEIQEEKFPKISLDRMRFAFNLIKNIPEDEYAAIWSGPYCWLCQNPRKLLKPIPTGGKLQLWKYTATAEELADVAVVVDGPVRLLEKNKKGGKGAKGAKSSAGKAKRTRQAVA